MKTEKEIDSEWLNKILPEQIEVSVKEAKKQAHKEVFDEIEKFQKEWKYKTVRGDYAIAYHRLVENFDEMKKRFFSEDRK